MIPIVLSSVRNTAATPSNILPPATRRKLPASMLALATFVLSLLVVPSALSQSAEFFAAQVRITVPLNSTNSTVITNVVDVVGVDTNAPVPVDFTVTDLPAGAAATLTDTNGNALLSSTIDTNLLLTVNTTNIAQGVYTFRLNATSPTQTNYILFVLQAANIWNGNLNVSNNWVEANAWLGGVPTATSDVVFGDQGAQTNLYSSGLAFTNIGIDANVTVASLRFSPTGRTNAVANEDDLSPVYHTIRLAPNTTLSVTGTNGFSIMRDYLDSTFEDNNRVGVTMVGGTSSRLVVSNQTANFALLVADQSFNGHTFLNLSNVNNLVAVVSRMGIAEYQLYPNYRNYNDVNDYSDEPAAFLADVSFARTNIITAIHKDPDNYTNELTRTYAFSLGSNEVDGNGSSVDSFVHLGQSNVFFLDSFCIGRANYAIGNNGSFRFNPSFPNATAIFRSTNNARMSVFTIADGGGTNLATDTTRINNVDFAAGNGLVDILADRFYMSRDRQLIASNNNPVVESQLIFGRGIIDVNTAVLGFQEHNGKTDWPAIGGAEAYRNYCRADLIVTNGGLFRVNGTLTLGYTADTNPSSSAEQFNTRGTVTIHTNSTVLASNIVVDGGLNFYNSSGRPNRITLNAGATLVVTNSIGNAPGLPLDTLSIQNGTIVFQNINPSRTNAFVRSLLTPGSAAGVIKINSMSGVSSFPVQIPVISYETASSPFLVANVTNLGAGFFGYVLDNVANKTVDLFITTNPPNNLTWRGQVNNNWDTTTKNWITTAGGLQTNFTLGDIVTFDDGTAVNNVNVVDSQVPGQTGTGVTFNNTTRNYTLSGGTLAGTALMVKQGTGSLTVDATKQGPITISGGTVNVAAGGSIGLATLAANTVLNCSGLINGGLTSTGTVSMASGSSLIGPVALRGGILNNSGTISNIAATMVITGNVIITNTAAGTMRIAGGNWDLTFGSTLANFGFIYNDAGRMNFAGTFFGTGSLMDPDGGLGGVGTIPTGIDGRLAANPFALWSPGDGPGPSVGTMYVGARIDLNNTPNTGLATLRVDVDFSHPQTNDLVKADRWNNIAGQIVMTNINPGAGSFAAGQVFQIFENNNGLSFPNFIDVNGTYPTMSPTLPGPGLQWGLFDFRTFGTISVTNTALVWDGTSSGNWDTNTLNTTWKGGKYYEDNQGAMFDDSASGTTAITLNMAVAPVGFDVTTNIVPNVSTNLFTNGPAMSPGIVISNTAKNYSLSGTGKVTGVTGLYKTGSGTLTILTTNDFAGNTIIAGGTVVVTNVNGLGGPPPSGARPNETFFDGPSTLRYVGLANATWPRVFVMNANNVFIEVISPTNELTASTIVGAGAVNKIGPGTLVLNSASPYSGVTTVNEGTVRVTGSDRAGSNTMALAGGALHFSGNAFTFTNAISVAGAGSRIINTNQYATSGPWSGSGSVTVSNTSILGLNGSLAGFSGTISLGNTSGNLRFNSATNSNVCTGSAAATFDLGTGSGSLSNLNGAGLTYDLGALLGGANTILGGRSTNVGVGGTTYSIGANGASTVFSGRIVNGNDTVTVTKVGSGTLTLNGINTFTGTTTVSAGTLGGNGSLSGPISVLAGGTLAPGSSAGRFTVSNTVTLAGTTIMELDRVNGQNTNDYLVANSITAGGTLIVTNIGPTIYNNSVFKLFSVPVTGFTSVTLPAGYGWNNNLAVDGTIVLTSGGIIATNPPTMTSSTVGSTLTLNWPATHIGWNLQGQTNTLAVGLSNNWVTIPGYETTNTAIISIIPAAPTVFYRLAYP